MITILNKLAKFFAGYGAQYAIDQIIDQTQNQTQHAQESLRYFKELRTEYEKTLEDRKRAEIELEHLKSASVKHDFSFKDSAGQYKRLLDANASQSNPAPISAIREAFVALRQMGRVENLSPDQISEYVGDLDDLIRSGQVGMQDLEGRLGAVRDKAGPLLDDQAVDVSVEMFLNRFRDKVRDRFDRESKRLAQADPKYAGENQELFQAAAAGDPQRVQSASVKCNPTRS